MTRQRAMTMAEQEGYRAIDAISRPYLGKPARWCTSDDLVRVTAILDALAGDADDLDAIDRAEAAAADVARCGCLVAIDWAGHVPLLGSATAVHFCRTEPNGRTHQ